MVCIEFNNIVAHVLGDHSPLQWQGNRPITSTDDEIPVDSVERPGRIDLGVTKGPIGCGRCRANLDIEISGFTAKRQKDAATRARDAWAQSKKYA
jgi:hypothetical protein